MLGYRLNVWWIRASTIPWLANNLAHGRANDDDDSYHHWPLVQTRSQTGSDPAGSICTSIHSYCDVLVVDGVGDSTIHRGRHRPAGVWLEEFLVLSTHVHVTTVSGMEET